MKLPSIIAGAAGSHGRAGPASLGDGKAGDGRAGFGHILSDLHEKAAGPSDHAPRATRGAAKATTSARTGQDTPGRDTLGRDTLGRGVTEGAASFDARTGSQAPGATATGQEDDGTVDKLLKRVGGDDATTEASTRTASPDPILSLVAPAAGLQMPAPGPVPTSQAQEPVETPAHTASTTAQPTGTSAPRPLISDVSVASQLAPTPPVPQAGAPLEAPTAPSAHAASPAAANQILGPDRPAAPFGETISALAGKPRAGQPTDGTATPSSGDRSKPSSSVAGATAVAVTAPVPPEAQIQGDGRSPSSALGASSRQAAEPDRATPRKDETPSFSDLATPATVDAPPAALSALSPPARQVAAALTRLAAETSAASGAAPVPDASTPRPTVARTLTLQISPASLGTVAVRMHASGGALDVQLTASDPQTAGLLSRERDALAASLQDRHTNLHSLVIQDGSAGPQPGGHHATQGDTSGAQGRAQRGGGDAGAGGDQRQRREQPESQARRDAAPDGGHLGPLVQPGGAGRALLV